MSCAIDDYADVHNTRIRKARIEHTCCACAETIRRGDRYRYTFQIYEGSAHHWKHCLRCAAIVDAITDAQTDPDDGVDPHLMCGHTWEENFGELPTEVAALAFMTADEAQATLVPEIRGAV